MMQGHTGAIHFYLTSKKYLRTRVVRVVRKATGRVRKAALERLISPHGEVYVVSR
jgi:hypothetical protein